MQINTCRSADHRSIIKKKNISEIASSTHFLFLTYRRPLILPHGVQRAVRGVVIRPCLWVHVNTLLQIDQCTRQTRVTVRLLSATRWRSPVPRQIRPELTAPLSVPCGAFLVRFCSSFVLPALSLGALCAVPTALLPLVIAPIIKSIFVL